MNIRDFPDGVALIQEIRNGTITSEGLVIEHLNRLKSLQPSLNAATKIYESEALEQAKELDLNGDKSLPLFGLPCSVKETFDIAGEEVTAGSLRRIPSYCSRDAVMVSLLRTAGAVIIARSNIPEFAMTGETTNLRFGRTNNPHDTSRVAGGSSGGEGALVGSGSTVFGLGSDILGSIRIPAAFCGTVGFKAHSGAIDSKGTWPEINTSLKSWLGYGPLCRSVRDAHLVYNVIAKKPIVESEDLFDDVIIPTGFPITYRQENIKDAVEAARKAVINKGMKSRSVSLEDIPKLFLNIPKIILNEFYENWIKDLSGSKKYGSFSLIKELTKSIIGKGTIDPGLLKWMLLKPIMKSRSNKKSEEVAKTFVEARNRYRKVIGADSILILPTLGLVAPKHKVFNRISLLDPRVNGLFTSNTLGNYLDLSAISIPGWKYCDPKTGLPGSVLLMCVPGQEARLFATARVVEAALN